MSIDFYKTIHRYYDKIFPLNENQVNFIINSLAVSSENNFLDIGCGTASLVLRMSPYFSNSYGIDSCDELLNMGRHKLSQRKNIESNIFLKCLKMQNLKSYFPDNYFKVITCFGNSLVHLSSHDEILDVLRQIYSILRYRSGYFYFQIINYDRILSQEIKFLPDIENKFIRFERKYSFNKNNKLSFHSMLTIKSNHHIVKNTIELLPLRKNELKFLLLKAGFNEVRFWGSFIKDPHNLEKSLPLIGIAK